MREALIEVHVALVQAAAVTVPGSGAISAISERLADEAVFGRDSKTRNARNVISCTDDTLIREAALRTTDAVNRTVGVARRDRVVVLPQVASANTNERRDRNVQTEVGQIDVVQDIDEAAVCLVGTVRAARSGRLVAVVDLGVVVYALNFNAQTVAEAPAERTETREAVLVTELGTATSIAGGAISLRGRGEAGVLVLDQVVPTANVDVRAGDRAGHGERRCGDHRRHGKECRAETHVFVLLVTNVSSHWQNCFDQRTQRDA